MNEYINISKEVQSAIENNIPVVALESTIISHGMPYPQNVEAALKVEEIVRENNAVPATVAIIKGIPSVGISKDQIDVLGKKGLSVSKASRRDIPILAACKEDGATTVAATMLISRLAGIKVFATGGIGGVHRGAEVTMDISADLEELSRTNVTVVCAGAKSILDIGLTLEYLETKGVPVVGYRTDDFPAFFTTKSGFKVNSRLNSAKEIANAIIAKDKLNMTNGMLVANPIPQEYSMDFDYISETIECACKEAKEKGISGKEVTPYLLDRIKQITKGASLKANIQLVYNNVKLGAQIAVELSRSLETN